MNKLKKAILLVAITLFIIAFAVIPLKFTQKEHTITFTNYFDTVSQITISSTSTKALTAVEKYLKDADHELSSKNPESLLYKFNQGENVTFSPDSTDLIEYGKKFSKENPDYFSIYLEPLISAWDIKNNNTKIPQIELLLKESQKENRIDLGGIAKGFVTDRIVDILKQNNVSSALINLGGNAYAMGKKITGENWRIGIQNPNEEDENSIIGVITAENLAVVTSGDYQRYTIIDGKKYHHILNPKTGYPAQNELRSVTVISDNSKLCDALSTAAFVAGLNDGINLVKKYNCMGIFVTDDTVYFSKELENIFKQTNFSYKYEFIY